MAVARALDCTLPGITTINFASAHIYGTTIKRGPAPDKAMRFRFARGVSYDWRQIKEWASQQIRHAPWPHNIPLGIEVLNVQA